MKSSRCFPGMALLWLAIIGLLPGLAAAQGQNTGSITGKITSTEGKPLPYANVLILGTAWGAMSNDTGSYTIKNVPVGTYSVKVMIIGYEDQTVGDVRVDKGAAATIDFKVKSRVVGVMDEVEITAARELIKLKSTETGHNINSKDMENLPVDEVSEMIGLKAGVIARGGELHFRGGRGGEVQYQVDGVPVRDPLVGGGVSLAALAIENAE